MQRLIEVAGREVHVEGGWLRTARLEGDKYRFEENPADLIAELRRKRAGIDLFTFMQGLRDTTPRFAYAMELDNFAALRVSSFDFWWKQQLDNKTRNMVRKGEKKGVIVREVAFDDDFVRGISAVYNETPVRQGRAFRHYRKPLEEVRREEGTFLESSTFLGAYLEDKLIGFAKLVPDESNTQAGLMNILSLIEHRDKAPTNALIAQAVRVCEARGIPFLVYANFGYGKKQNDTLATFKESNGFVRIDVPRYYVPLTAQGALAFRLGMHKRISERLPETLLSRVRDFRANWYKRRLLEPARKTS